MRCRFCGTTVPDAEDTCPSCVASLGEPKDPQAPTTVVLPERDSPGRPRARTDEDRSPPRSSPDASRFRPGDVLADRYRMVSMLGRGSMGEVYRADDLKLGQPVALKFLPAGLELDEQALARLLDEVKIARQITHPNVCRVFDVGEWEGIPFISMEYVEGEDLRSLRRRIGRLPEERAIEIARQLAGGLAAAHQQGILHRDLKPANVMIDAAGRVRLADFGVAVLAESAGSASGGTGTPAYMAPEQHGEGASIASDLYALGLVLYELVTGQPAFRSPSVDETLRLHRETPPTPPSRVVAGLDPALERVILQCLEKNPLDRPASAQAVAAALPSADSRAGTVLKTLLASE
ncbi:MAG: serine/threonine protein kinase, partial [bacterium]|nr:serine/threonine protein kinase [bacterium]